MAIRISVPIVTDAKEANQSIRDLNAELKQVESISRVADEELKQNADSAAALALKYGALGDKLRIQTELLEQQQIGLAATKKQLEEKRSAIEDATKEFENNSQGLDENSKEYKKLADAVKTANIEFDVVFKRVTKYSNDIKVSEAKVRVLTESVNGATQSLTGMSAQTDKASESSRNLTTTIAGNAIAIAAVDALKAALGGVRNYLYDAAKASMQFEVSQKQLYVTMSNMLGATQENLDANALRGLTVSTYEAAAAQLKKAEAHLVSVGAAEAEIAAIHMQIAAIERLRSNLSRPLSADRPQRATGGTDNSDREAEREHRERIAAWERVYQERERISREWINRQQFYNELSAYDTVAANERVLEYLREFLQEAKELYWVSAEERAEITRNITQLIERYERDHWTAMRALQQEGEVDRERMERARMDALQREIDRAESNIDRYRAYGEMRIALEEQLYARIEKINSRWWYNERETRHAIEDLHRDFVRNIERIDDRRAALRQEQVNLFAQEWRMEQINTLDEQRAQLDAAHNIRREALTRELQQIREHFAALDAEERRHERAGQMADLQREYGYMSVSATRAGQGRAQQLRNQKENLQRQEERDQRRALQEQQEAEIRTRMETLNATHRMEVEALNAQRANVQAAYKEMRHNAAQLAADTANNVMDANFELTMGLTDMYEQFGENVNKMSNDMTLKLEKTGLRIQAVLARLQAAIANIGNFSARLGGGGVTNNDNRRVSFSVGTQVFNNAAESQRAFDEFTMLGVQGLIR